MQVEMIKFETSFIKNIFSDNNLTNISSQMKVTSLFPSYFSLEDRSAFTTKVTLHEVERALKSFKKDKSLGPDGFLVEFFLAFFDLLGEELVNLVEDSRLAGRVLHSLNSTFIDLIPKSDKPTTFADFRPISLCNLIYKLIAKVVVTYPNFVNNVNCFYYITETLCYNLC